ncbi:MAG: phosphoribosyltransferase [Candidatus Bathyarchaeota archaeon]
MDKDIDSQKLDNNFNFIFPNWGQIYASLIDLSDIIQKSHFEPDLIVGISRGGLIPARILSDLLQNPKLASITTEFYFGIGKPTSKPVITQQISISIKNKKILVVDDVADSGKSLTLINHHLKEKGAKEIKFVTIYLKFQSSFIPDYYKLKTNDWIVFPWELKEATKLIVQELGLKGKNIEYSKEKLISSGMNKMLIDRFIKEIFGE